MNFINTNNDELLKVARDTMFGWALPWLDNSNHKSLILIIWAIIFIVYEALLVSLCYFEIAPVVCMLLIGAEGILLFLIRIYYYGRRKKLQNPELTNLGARLRGDIIKNMMLPGMGLILRSHVKVIGVVFILTTFVIFVVFRQLRGLYSVLAVVSNLYLLRVKYPEIYGAKKKLIYKIFSSSLLIMLAVSSLFHFNIIFLMLAYTVSSESMEPGIQVGNSVIVNKTSYLIKPPENGDIVLFEMPGSGKDAIKRVGGVAGDVIRIDNGQLYRDGKLIETMTGETYKMNFTAGSDGYFIYGLKEPYTVPPNSVFIIGDNRGWSLDSRYWGAIPLQSVKGKVVKKLDLKGQ